MKRLLARVSRPGAAVALLILAVLTVVVTTYSRFSHTWDEPSHMATGLERLDLGSYYYEHQHPPLARMALAAGPYLDGHHSGRASMPVRTDFWDRMIQGFDDGRRVLYQEGPVRAGSHAGAPGRAAISRDRAIGDLRVGAADHRRVAGCARPVLAGHDSAVSWQCRSRDARYSDGGTQCGEPARFLSVARTTASMERRGVRCAGGCGHHDQVFGDSVSRGELRRHLSMARLGRAAKAGARRFVELRQVRRHCRSGDAPRVLGVLRLRLRVDRRSGEPTL